jgi:4-hydroxy-4-methyl-2-oxoglutarate aldolase
MSPKGRSDSCRRGGALIRSGDIVILDADGALVIEAERAPAVLAASKAREARETDLRARLQSGHLSIDLHGLRERVNAELGQERSWPE